MAVAISASAIPGATICSVACFTAPSAIKACIIPHTVPNRPIYGLIEPTVPRKGMWFSSVSSSRFIEMRMARDAPSITDSGAWLLARCKRANSLKPEWKICSEPVRLSRRAWLSWYRRESSIPDQNLSSKASASRVAAFRMRVRWMMIAQEATEKHIKINMISLTSRLAFKNKSRMFMSVTA